MGEDLPRRTLRELIARHGTGLCSDARRCEGLLRDLCGAHRREINILMGESKRVAGLAVADRGREREVIDRACRQNRGPLDDGAVARLFRAVIRESRRLQTEARSAGVGAPEGAGR